MSQSLGSVYQRQDGLWCAAVRVNGKRRVVYGKTEREARKKLSEIQKTVASTGGLPDSSRRTVSDLLDAWLDAVRPTLKPRTVADYEAVSNLHIRNQIGATRLDRITPQHLQSLYAALQARGLTRAPQKVHVIIHRAFRMAVLWRWLTDNPADRVIRPAYHAERKDVWCQHDLSIFLSATRHTWQYPVWALAAATGCRLSELLGLKWEDVNLAVGYIEIRRSLHRINHCWVESTPKTRAGTRRIALPQEAISILRRQKAQQAEWKLKAGSEWIENGHVFTSPTGQPLSQSVVQKAIRRECNRLGLSNIGMHGLRHEHASLLLDKGLPITAVSARLGHANPSITLQVYSHALKGQDQQAASVMDSVLAVSR